MLIFFEKRRLICFCPITFKDLVQVVSVKIKTFWFVEKMVVWRGAAVESNTGGIAREYILRSREWQKIINRLIACVYIGQYVSMWSHPFSVAPHWFKSTKEWRIVAIRQAVRYFTRLLLSTSECHGDLSKLTYLIIFNIYINQRHRGCQSLWSNVTTFFMSLTDVGVE